MKPNVIVIIFLIAILLSGCNFASLSKTASPAPTAAPSLEFIQPNPTQPAFPTEEPTTAAFTATPETSDQAVLDLAAQVVAALKQKDMVALAAYVNPTLGLRFSPYAAVKENDQVIPANQLSSLFSDKTVYTWGAYSGTGEPINLTFTDYYATFIYDVDFANAPKVALNNRLGVSTTLDNAAEFYPGAMIVEYYFPGFDPAVEGLDWRSLRLVFLEENDSWYLVDIIHDQWTT